MRTTRIQMIDFKGQTTEVRLSPVTLLTGRNGSGKTTILEAESLALTGCLPGYRPRDMDAATLADLAGPSGRFAIIHEDDAGGVVRREFLGASQRVRLSAPGLAPLPDKNEDHEAAIVARYGEAATTGVVSIDLSALLAMTPDQLRAWVLDLCTRAGGGSAWTPDQILRTLWDRVPGCNGIVYPPDLEEGVLPTLDYLDETLASLLTQARSDVRATTQDRKAVFTPPAPANEIEAVEGEVARLNAALGEAREEKGRIEATVQARKAESQRGREAVTKLREALTGAKRAQEAVLQRQRDAEQDVERLKAEVARMEGAAPAAETPAREAELEAAKAAAPAKPGCYDTIKAQVQAVDALDKEFLVANVAQQEQDKETARVLARVQSLSSGTCPTCGQATAAICDSLASEAASAQQNLAAVRARAAEILTRLERARIEKDARVAECRKYDVAVKRHAEQVAAAEKALASARLADSQAREKHQASLAEKRQALAVRCAEGNGILVEVERLAGEIDRLAADVQRAELAQPTDTGIVAPELDKVTFRIATLAGDLVQVQEHLSGLRHGVEEYLAAVRRRDAAENEYVRLQGWQQALKAGIECLVALREEVIAGVVAPLISRVNSFTEGFLGQFGARFAPRFALGFLRKIGGKDAWVPLYRLSTGEFAIAALAIGVAVTDMRRVFVESPMRLLCFDNIEVLDVGNLADFLGAVDGCVQAGDFDQVLLAGRPMDAEVPAGIAVIEMCGNAAAVAA